MKACKAITCIAPSNLNLSAWQRWVVSITPRLLHSRKRTLVPVEYDAELATELVGTFWRMKKKPLVPSGIRTSEGSARSLVFIPNTLNKYKYIYEYILEFSCKELLCLHMRYIVTCTPTLLSLDFFHRLLYRVRQKNLTVLKSRYIGNRVGWGNATKVSC